MEKSGLNLNNVKERNISSILYLLNSKNGLSRKDVAEELSLTPAAVTKLCSALIENGFVKEAGVADGNISKAGRKKIILNLCLSDFYAVGVNAEVDKITVSAFSLDSTLLNSVSLPSNASSDEITERCRFVIDESGVDKNKFVCVSICVIGSPNDNSFGLWDTAEVKEKIETQIKLPIVCENNICAFALAELIYGHNRYSGSELFLKWGPGIGSAVAANGEIISSGNTGAAEIGHYIIRRDGARCRCGRYGCLETEVSSMVIAEEVGSGISFDDIIRSDNKDVINILDEKADIVALALTNTATILNARKIILFGSVFANEAIAEKVARQCRRYNCNFKDNTIELSKLNKSISYIGPAALAAKKFFFEHF